MSTEALNDIFYPPKLTNEESEKRTEALLNGYMPATSDDINGNPVDDRATELANAEEVHRLYGTKLKYHADRGEFYVWTGTHWKRDIDGQVHGWTKAVAKASVERLESSVEWKELTKFRTSIESSKGINGVMKL